MQSVLCNLDFLTVFLKKTVYFKITVPKTAKSLPDKAVFYMKLIKTQIKIFFSKSRFFLLFFNFLFQIRSGFIKVFGHPACAVISIKSAKEDIHVNLNTI